MDINLQDYINNLLADESQSIDVEKAEAIMEKYPFFTLPGALLLKRNPESISAEKRSELTNRLALYASDNQSFMEMIDPEAAEMASFYPKEEPTEQITTENAISTFLDTYGHTSPEEEALLEKLIFNPTPDYGGVLQSEADVPAHSDAPAGSQDALIDAFIAKTTRPVMPKMPEPEPEVEEEKPAAPVPIDTTPVTAPEVNDDSLLSESLAKIYIKQRRYSKAFEIISNLSLNYPEKSVYFADQLRFLQKLIINQEYSNKK
jgi:hypothetical protein